MGILALLGAVVLPLVLGRIFHLRWPGAGRWGPGIDKKEYLLLSALGLVFSVGAFYLARWGALRDFEHWHGRISGHLSGSQSCCHCTTYCDTCTDSDGNTYDCNCYEECDHSQDYWWSLEVDTGDVISIDSCEPDPNRVPAAWSNAYRGEPASVRHGYTNYLKARPEQFFPEPLPEGAAEDLPERPRVHSYYRRQHVIGVDVEVPAGWQAGLAELNAEVGSEYQVDVMVVLARRPREWADWLAQEWLLGPKNGLIVVCGLGPSGSEIEWVEAISLSLTTPLAADLREDLQGRSIEEVERAITRLEGAIERRWARVPMADYAWMARWTGPPWWLLLPVYVLTGLATWGMARWMNAKMLFRPRPQRR